MYVLERQGFFCLLCLHVRDSALDPGWPCRESECGELGRAVTRGLRIWICVCGIFIGFES